MSAAVAVRGVSPHGIVRCPSCSHFLPRRTDAEVTCTSCGVTYPVD